MATRPVRPAGPRDPAPPVEPPFEPAGEHIAIALSGGRALFTSRRGGVSEGPYATLNLGLTGAAGAPRDDPARVRVNRGRLAASIGIPWDRVARRRQVHGTSVDAIRDPTEAPLAPEAPAPGDGAATALAGVAALVLVADCLPVALFAPGAVAMVHAGWRGLAAGVIEEGVRVVRELDPRGGSEMAAAIGPGIGVCCYQVGPEVRDALGDLGVEASAGDRIDLKLIARRRLGRAGVSEVHDVGLCTACSPPELFFSHRRDGGVTGRQCGVVWRS